MGMFDTVFIDCPECGKTTELQSKAGWCILSEFTFEDAPPAILGDLDGDKLDCDCGYVVRAKVTMTVEKSLEKEYTEEDLPYDY